MIVQKINIDVKDAYEMSFKYFSILSILNGMNLVKRDVQLLSYAISQDKPISAVKKEFVKKFGTSMATVNNIISKLYKLNILKKHKRVVKINPILLLDFNSDLMMGISLKHTYHGDKG